VTQLDQKIARQDPEFVRLAVERSIALEELQQALREDEAMVVVIGGRDVPLGPTPNAAPIAEIGQGVYIAAISRSDFTWRRATIGTLELARTTRLLRCQLDRTSCGDLTPPPNSFDTGAAHALYTALLAPLAPVIDEKPNLIVVATGSLSALPLTVLTTKPKPIGWRDDDPRLLAQAAWLTRDHSITVVPTPGSLVALRTTIARPAGERVPFAGFGDPDLSGTRANGETRDSRLALAPLPWSDFELSRLRDLTGTPAELIFTGSRATEHAVKTTALDRIEMLMFATHGVAAGEWPNNPEPGLVLTQPVVLSPDDDGFLSASEVSQLQLDADWVILSACRTAGSDGRPEGDSLSGLAKAFFHAGARSLLVAYWTVRDDVAATLTTEAVMRRHAGASITRAQALRLSILEVLGDTDDPSRAHPSVWAPLVLIGSDGKL